MAILTKEILLNGIENTTEFKLESADGSVVLRPLSQKEVSEIDQIQSKGVGTFETQEKSRRGRRVTNSVESMGRINVAKANAAKDDAQVRAVALSLSCKGEKWTDEEAGALKNAVFKEIYGYVKELSGLEDEELTEDVEEFHEDESE